MIGMRVRLTTCARCGDGGRLIISTPEETISRCPMCGDEWRSEAPLPVAEVKGVPVEADSQAVSLCYSGQRNAS
jgi:hypothetical protein